MADRVSFRVSPAAAAYIRGGKTEQLKVLRGECQLAPLDRVIVLFFLVTDADPQVKKEASEALRTLSDDEICDVLAHDDIHPKVLNLLARLHFRKEAVAEAIAVHPAVDPATLEFLAAQGCTAAEVTLAVPEDQGDSDDAPEDFSDDEDLSDVVEYQSKYQMAQVMSVAEKIKMALTGDKEWRSILVKDANKLINSSVVRNGRITEGEVLTIIKSSVQNDEIIRIISHNKEWLKNYQIRRALVENNKTPVPTALRLLSTLTEKDIASLAKSKNISTIIVTQARKLVLAKLKR